MTEQPTVALLGIGTMGAGMAKNIAAAGLPLQVWNRSPEKAEPLKEIGAQVAATPAEAVDGASVVITMLFDGPSVASVIEEAAPSLAPGTIWAQMSTVGVVGHEALTRVAAKHDLIYVDAPVLGTKQPAADGALVVLASGPDSAKATLEPIFDAIGQRTMWLGEAGNGTKLKLVANGWVLTVLDGVAQSLRMAQSLGLDPQWFLDAVKGGAMDAPYVALKAKAMLTDQYDPSFAVSGAAKDAGLIEEAARAAGADPAFVSIARKHLDQAVEEGHGDKDMAAVYLSVPPTSRSDTP